MREENGTFQDLRPAGARADAGGFVSVGEPAPRSGDGGPAAPGPVIALAPRTSGQILDTAIDLARDRFGLYVLAASSVWFFVRLARPLVGLDEIDPFGSSTDPLDLSTLQALDILAQFFAQQLAIVLVALLAWPRITGEPVHAGAVLRRAAIVVVPLLVLQVVTSVIVGMGALLTCGLGLFYFPWKMSLAALCYALERSGFGGAIGRSWRLTSHAGWSNDAFFGFLRWVAVVGTGYLFYSATSGLVGAADLPDVRAAVLEATGVPGGLYDALYVTLTTLVIGIGSAVFSIVVLAYYLDCRVRRDGFDLDHRLAALRERWKDPAHPGADAGA